MIPFVSAGWEQIGRLLCKERGYEWEEYWPCFDCLEDMGTLRGLSRLEALLESSNTRFCRGKAGI
jgi:hypothetical protein